MFVKDRIEQQPERPWPKETSGSAVDKTLLSGILDRCLRAILAIDHRGRVLYQNAAAQALTARSDLLCVRNGLVSFIDQGVSTRVRTHIRNHSRQKHTMDALPSLALRLDAQPSTDSCATSCATYRLLLSALDYGSPDGSSGAVWLLFVSAMDEEHHIQTDVLTQLYGLTHAESSLVAMLFAGNTLESAARKLRVSINTAKSHLRQVFLKCDVQSQAGLLKLVALGPRSL